MKSNNYNKKRTPKSPLVNDNSLRMEWLESVSDPWSQHSI